MNSIWVFKKIYLQIKSFRNEVKYSRILCKVAFLKSISPPKMKKIGVIKYLVWQNLLASFIELPKVTVKNDYIKTVFQT